MYSYVQFGDVGILGYFIHRMIYLKFEGIMVPQIELIIVLDYSNFIFLAQNTVTLR